MSKIVELSKNFKFDAAHYLLDYKGKCENLHGHTYKMRVTVSGEVQSNGLVMDFAELKKIVNEEIIDKFDHANINDFLKHSTAENMCIYAWEKIEKKLPEKIKLKEIKIWETENSVATYRG